MAKKDILACGEGTSAQCTIECVSLGASMYSDFAEVNAEGRLHFIGHCSGFTNQDRVAILEQLGKGRGSEEVLREKLGMPLELLAERVPRWASER